MAVIIQNISEQAGLRYGIGEQRYQVRINQKHFAFVTHRFEDGLASLLRKAATAVEQAECNGNIS